jgi:hypothetical protein
MRHTPHTWSSRATSIRQSWCTRMASTGDEAVCNGCTVSACHT